MVTTLYSSLSSGLGLDGYRIYNLTANLRSFNMFQIRKDGLLYSHGDLIITSFKFSIILKGYSEIIVVITPSIFIKSEIFAFW